MSLIGVDIGGTNIRVGLLTPEGVLLARRSTPTRPERGNGAAIEQLVELIESLLAGRSATPDAIGVAVTGPADPRTGVVNNPYTLAGWGPTDLIAPLRERFNVSVEIENDANAAALGEWWRGAGRLSRRLATVTIGTGIGVGLLVDGCVQRKPDGSHGEAGHHVLDPHGPPCYCGAHGCWEVLAAGPAITRAALQVGTLGVLADIDPENPDAIADAVITTALAGDPAATSVLNEIAEWIGLGLVNLVAFFTPNTVVLGGGVGARCFSVMAPTIERVLEQHRPLVPTEVKICVAETGDDAGMLGAALAALRSRAIPNRVTSFDQPATGCPR